MYMIFQGYHRIDDHVMLPCDLLKHRTGIFGYLRLQDPPAAFPNPHQTAFEMTDRMLTSLHSTYVVASLWQAETYQTMILGSPFQQTGEHPVETG
jgi:hypothetical protein